MGPSMCGRRVSAAASVAAAFVIVASCASAGPIEVADSARFIFFSGLDLWREGNFAHGGLLWSPGGVDQEGFTLKTLISGGTYRYTSGALGNARVTGTETVGQFLPGWQFKSGTLELKVFAGLDLEEHHLSPDDPSSGLHGHDTGVRGAFDLWYEPVPRMMVAADGSLSSIVGTYSARGALGWRAFDFAYIGPEVQTYACDGYRQIRFGVHLTGFKTGQFEWSLAAGWARDSDAHTGAYGRIGVMMRR